MKFLNFKSNKNFYHSIIFLFLFFFIFNGGLQISSFPKLDLKLDVKMAQAETPARTMRLFGGSTIKLFSGKRFSVSPPVVATADVFADSSILFHIDAQDVYNGSNPTADTAITGWDDLSGNGVDFVNTTAAGTYRSGGPNSKNYVQFGSSAAGIKTSAISRDLVAGSSGNTLTTFLVMRYNSGIVFLKWESSAGNRYGIESANRFDFATDALADRLTGWSLGTSWTIFEIVIDGGVKYLYKDGSLLASHTPTDGVLNAVSSQPYFIGTNAVNESTLGAIVDVAEAVHYNSTLSSTKRDEIRSFLQTKYGL